MMQLTLHFSSTIELIEFQDAANAAVEHYNLTDLTLTGTFSEADLELAQAGFGAVVAERAKEA